MQTNQEHPESSFSIFDQILRKAVVSLIQEEICTDEELISFRKRTCEACQYLLDGRCTICDCFYDLKAETLVNRKGNGFEVTHCPMGFWGDQETAEYYQTILKT